jgi:hypothetical protein
MRSYNRGPKWKQIKAARRSKADDSSPTDDVWSHPDDIAALTENKIITFGDFLGPAFLIYEYYKARGEHIAIISAERRYNRRIRSTERFFEAAVTSGERRAYDVYLRVDGQEVYEYGRVEHLRN